MKSTCKAAAVVVMVTILVANPVLLASGNPVPGRWEKVAETRMGDKIKVDRKDGVAQKCRYKSITDEFMICTNENEDEIQIELGTIDKVFLSRAGKYAKQGIIWGAAGGAGVLCAVASQTGPSTELGFGAAAIIGAVLGAGAGYAAGAAIGTPGETIFISKEAALAKAARK